MSVAVRIAALVFVAAVVQVSAIAGARILGAELDLLVVTVIAIAIVRGAVAGAWAGFAAGLLVDVMTLGTLGLTSLLLTPAGFWAGRYGETTGRGRRYAAPLAALVITLLLAPAAVALHFLLGEYVSVTGALAPLVPTALLATALAIPVTWLVRGLLGEPDTFPRAQGAELV